jgi:hypothetical protein
VAYFVGRTRAGIEDLVRKDGPVRSWRHRYASKHKSKVRVELSRLNNVFGSALPQSIPIAFSVDGDYVVKRVTKN